MAPPPPPSNSSFVFGSGASFNFSSPDDAPPPPSAASAFAVPQIPGSLARLHPGLTGKKLLEAQRAVEIELAEVRHELMGAKMELTLERAESADARAAWTEQMQVLHKESDTCRGVITRQREEILALERELQAFRAALCPSGGLASAAAMPPPPTDDYDRIAELQSELDAARDRISALQQETAKLQGVHDNDLAEVQRCQQQVAAGEQHQEELRAVIERLRNEVTAETANAAAVHEHLNGAYADLEQVRLELERAIKGKDDAEVECEAQRLQFNSLHEQWTSTDAHLQELQQQTASLESLEWQNKALEDDLDNLRHQLYERESALVVKDERIIQLEREYQKERQRNIEATELAAITATASPVDEAPMPFSNIGDSLADELDAASDYVDDAEEPLELSAVTQVYNVSPLALVSPALTLELASTVHTTPVNPLRSPLAIQVVQAAATTTPKNPVTATMSTATTQTEEPASSTSNIASVTSTISISPVEAAYNVNDTATQTEEPALITSNIIGIATIPIEATPIKEPVLGTSDITGIATTPVEANHAEPVLSTSSITGIATSPALALYNVDSAATQTDEPAHIILQNTAATQTAVSVLETSGISTIATSPQEPAYSLATAVIQTDEPALAKSNIITLSTSPIAVKDAPELDLNLYVSPIVTAINEQPLDAIENPVPTIPETDTTGTQTTQIPNPTIIYKDVPIAKESTNKLLAYVLPFITLLLLAFSFHQHLQLEDWRYVNGVSHTSSYDHRTGGAFGNGRYLFGVIPVGMGIGNSWAAECFARYAAETIMRLEGWAGISRAMPY